jgi:phytoene/squalene synthetase
MDKRNHDSLPLAATITKKASKQTYYTIRYFVDRELIPDAYRAYGYFRWVDDVLDEQTGSGGMPGEVEAAEKIAFINRQRDLLEACYREETPERMCPEEHMLADLVRNDSRRNPGLQSYLRNMMAVMEFDAGRNGRVVSGAELGEYSRHLAVAVTDAMYYFIGHDDPAPRHKARYQAVNAAHVTHMLRDTLEDIEAGYFNVPCEYLQEHEISPHDVESRAYREWVCHRVGLARGYFKAGWKYLAQDKNLRRRLAGYAYTARFEWMLRAIERDNYCLRAEYCERKSLFAGLWMGWRTLSSMSASAWTKTRLSTLAVKSARIKEL